MTAPHHGAIFAARAQQCFAPADLFHGAVDSLDAVLGNVTHRSARTSGVDTLTSAADRAKAVRFLESIDAGTTPIP